jgi:sterol desaturase/sphingolipid hydroxylase (fatty acid hydroxylase superfamily)
MFIAGLIQCYILEEWVHHSVHFYNFRNRYFRYIRKHHLYHHSPRGGEVAYGLTNGVWDVLRNTRIPAHERKRLYG